MKYKIGRSLQYCSHIVHTRNYKKTTLKTCAKPCLIEKSDIFQTLGQGRYVEKIVKRSKYYNNNKQKSIIEQPRHNKT